MQSEIYSSGPIVEDLKNLLGESVDLSAIEEAIKVNDTAELESSVEETNNVIHNLGMFYLVNEANLTDDLKSELVKLYFSLARRVFEKMRDTANSHDLLNTATNFLKIFVLPEGSVDFKNLMQSYESKYYVLSTGRPAA